MARVDRPVPLVLDKPRTILLDIEALCEAEDALSLLYGRDISVYEVLTHNPPRLNDLCVVVHHGLLHEDASLTLKDVKQLMNYASFPTILQAVTNAWAGQTASAEAQELTTLPDPPPDGPTGDGSGPLPVSNSGLENAHSGS